MIRGMALACTVSVALVAAPAVAETGTEMLFDTAQIADVAVGSSLEYSHRRSAAEEVETQAIEDGTILVTLFDKDGKRLSKVTLTNGKRRRALEHLPGDRGNPIFVTFLESSLSAIARATKGSPFYLRNRVKDALGTGGAVTTATVTLDGREIEATRIEYKPFENDRNRDKLGAGFTNLSLIFRISDEVPGKFIDLTADAGADGEQVFNESIRFVKLDGED